MKRTTLIVYAIALGVTFFMCSYKEGAATHGWDCTGGETGLGNAAGCANGGGCHSTTATPGIVVTLQLDSVGVPVTSYKAGLTYTVTIKGVNTTTNVLPKFGFQVAAFKGATPQVTPVNEGTFQQTGLPASVHYQTPVNITYTVANVIEQSSPLAPDSGTGGNGTVYTESFSWTAPVAGTGTVSLWAALNAVNFDGQADSQDKWDTTHLVLNEDTAVTVNAVTEIKNALDVSIYPNPLSDAGLIALTNVENGTYALSVFDEQGKEISQRAIEVTSGSQVISLNTSVWATGIYLVKIANSHNEKVMKVVKK